MSGVPNYHLKTTHCTFGGSIFSGTKLKANTKMETDVKRASSSTLLYNPCFHPFSLSLPLCRLLWPNIMSGGWKNKSKTMVVKVENCAVKISDQFQPIRMNLQWTCSRETLRDDTTKGQRTLRIQKVTGLYAKLGTQLQRIMGNGFLSD